MTTYMLTLTAPERIVSAIADHLADGDGLVADAAGAFDLGDGSWGLEAYFPSAPDPDHLVAAVMQILGRTDGVSAEEVVAALAGLQLRPLDGADWSDIGLDQLPPIVAGRFRVFGEHNRPDAAHRRSNDLIIEASTAFGTGDHASTFLALVALDAVLKLRRPTRILDVGTGTGILALAAAKVLPAARIVATDIEPVAIRMCDINRQGNGAGSTPALVLADGLGHPTIRAGAPYQLVLANILPAPLCRLAPAIVAAMAPGALLILAGLRRGEESRLIAAYRSRGLTLARRYRAKEWSSLVLVKP